MFSDLEDRAFSLGRRMAEAAFAMDDNPFANLQPRLARKWLDGFVSENALLGKAGWLGQDGHHPHADEPPHRRTEPAVRGPEVIDVSHARVRAA